MDKIRLQKFLADCGVASRRKAEELITTSRVKVNGITTAELGVKVSPSNDIIHLDGLLLKLVTEKIYLMLNKPCGVVTTVSDEFNRRTVIDLISKDFPERVFPIGRLDKDTGGLLLLTNDGDTAYVLTHPKHHINKVYIAEVDVFNEEQLRQLSHGVVIDGRRTAPPEAIILSRSKDSTKVRITICEGRNRQVRKMFEAVGSHVKSLARISIGELSLGNLKPGQFRHLSKKELEYLKNI